MNFAPPVRQQLTLSLKSNFWRYIMAVRNKKVKITLTNRKRLILAAVEELASKLVYTDRKNDPDLSVNDFESAMVLGEVRIGEIIDVFKTRLKDGLSHLNIPKEIKHGTAQTRIERPDKEDRDEVSFDGEVLDLAAQFARTGEGNSDRHVHDPEY
jgi:hypothetical protein